MSEFRRLMKMALKFLHQNRKRGKNMNTNDNRDEKQGFEEQTEEREYIIKDI